MNRKKILIVDDEPSILEVMKLILESDYDVLTTGRGEDAEELKEGSLPDIILLDILLPGKDGREIARKLKSKKETQHIPIILVSAHASASSSIRECGADDFLAKPFDMQELQKKVARYVR